MSKLGHGRILQRYLGAAASFVPGSCSTRWMDLALTSRGLADEAARRDEGSVARERDLLNRRCKRNVRCGRRCGCSALAVSSHCIARP